MLGKRLINTGSVACTTDTVQILDAGTTETLALYRFEDNAFDTSGSLGYINKGGYFNGSAKIVLAAGSFRLVTFSISAWIRQPSQDSSDIILENYDYQSSTSRGFIFRTASGKLKFDGYYSDAAVTTATSNESVPLNTWTHVACVFNPSASGVDRIKLFINGSEATYSARAFNDIQYHTTCPTTIGALSYTGASDEQQFVGSIDELRIYDDALTATEIGYIANNTTASIPTGNLAAHYQFEGNANDSTSYPINGLATNVIYDYDGTESNITYVTGKFGKAASFNGSSSRVVLPSGEPFGDSDTIKCISAWIKPNSTSTRMHVFSVSGNDAYDYFRAAYDGNNSVISTYSRRDNSNNSSYQYASITPDTNWHHVVFQLGSSGVEIYLDNTKLTLTSTTVGSATNSSWIAYPNYGGTIVTQIGKSRQVTPQWSDGLQDQTRLFNRALSAGEINSLYNETATSAASATIDNPSTVAYYKMADGTDETGNYDATSVSNVDFNVQGKYGFAGNFNGSSSQIITGYTPLAGTTAATISLWINFNSYANSYAVIAGDNNSGSTHLGFLMLATGASGSYGSNGHLWVSLGNQSNGYDINTSVSFDSYGGIGSWIHVAVTVSGASVSIYMNGTLATSYTSSISYAPTASAYAYRLGYISGWGYLDAKLDQIRFFNKAISASEVSKLYNEIQCANTIDTPESHFNTKLFTPTTSSSALPVTGVGFTPDLIWAKYRGTGSGYANQSHYWYDTVRGINSRIFSNSNQAESTSSYVQSFDTDGITYVNNLFNRTGADSVVGWFWKAGGPAVAGSANHYINVEKSVNDEAGFSIVRFDFPFVSGGNALVPNDASYNHGLSKKPDLIITKTYNGYLGAADWYTWASPLGAGTNGLRLNDNSDGIGQGYFGTIDSTKAEYRFSSNNINGLSAVVTYNFRNIDGYQRIGSYAGNGSANGPFVFTGFEPAWLLIKQTSTSGNDWVIYDNKRNTTNPRFKFLVPNDSDAETGTNASNYPILDFLSNGFAIKGTDGRVNTNGSTYLFWAIAANPDTTAPTKANSFNVKLYTGTGNTHPITQLGFKPDFVWIKDRGTTGANHVLSDSVRGTGRFLISNNTDTEYVSSGGTLSSFDPDGFSLAAASPAYDFNINNNTYVAWAWKALDHDRNLPTINNDGSTTSLVSANPAAGFSISSYRGVGYPNSATATVGHGLSQAPELVIIKGTGGTGQSGGAGGWCVGTGVLASNNWLGSFYLYTTGEYHTAVNYFWNGSPTSSVVKLKNDWFVNGVNNSYIMYSWHTVAGYSKIGVYSGSGNSGKEVALDFSPSFVLIKRTDASAGWIIVDDQRSTYELYPHLNNQEDTTTTNIVLGTNKFTLNTTGSWYNALGGTYLYMAFK